MCLLMFSTITSIVIHTQANGGLLPGLKSFINSGLITW